MAENRKKIKKVLVANRGEIAVRIIRACREMGIETVAVFSDEDFNSLHVRLADEALHIGAATASESYLRIDKMIDAAIQSGADAIHPGYGFLAENPQLSDACRERDIIFVGPDSDVIKALGEKTIAKETMIKAGIPTIPGIQKALVDLDEARSVAEQIGYPVILKASMGGGGRGMRVIRSEIELLSAFRAAKSEALAAFGSESIFMEKLILNPRHIEFQVLGDRHGNVIHLGERDCTLQRRNQKLLEEAPSPFLDDKMRKQMGEAAVNAAKASNYHSAGTVEFLIDTNNNFYFMEMNTRIQVEHPVTEMVTGVEHPVTEMVTGIDLIKEQIRIAQGEKLKFNQADIKIKGWAIECRINAEDPFRGFIPNPGKIEYIRFPMGPGIRIDTSVFDGYEIPRQYDSLIAKIVVHADTRKDAITRMKYALSELKIRGIKTTKEFMYALISSREFTKTSYDTSFVERNFNKLRENLEVDGKAAAIAAAIDVYLYSQKMHRHKPEVDEKPGRRAVRNWKMSHRLQSHGR
jgi:acetyl-CoA carboxylase biotin carboxylase subunit